MYDVIVVGAGAAGAAAARILAEKGKKVRVLEKRPHVGGNCYDEKDSHGVLIHKYGPHIFHTNDKKVYDFLSRFTKWDNYQHEVVGNIYGKIIPVPFNLNSLEEVYGKEKASRLEEKLIKAYGEGKKVPILELKESVDPEIREISNYVYENVFLKYTMKQWGQKPEEVDASVTARVPVLLSRDNRYFQDEYQGMPENGYTPMFQKMLDHENIDVVLGKDAAEELKISQEGIFLRDGSAYNGIVIYTGPIDELFDYKYGRLHYRSLDFDFEYYEQDSFQGRAVVNYTVTEDFTRITEFKYLTGQKVKGTTIVKEYPRQFEGKDGQIPYYAILNEENNRQYEKYLSLAKGLPGLYMLGRLAEYKYYNIDGIVGKAVSLSEKLR